MNIINDIFPNDIALIIHRMHTRSIMLNVMDEILLLERRAYNFNLDLDMYWYMRWERVLKHVYNFYFH